MNSNEKDFENIVSRLNIDDSPDDAHRQNLRRRMLSVFNEKSSRRAITFQTIAGTIIKSRLAKLAAAAVIILAVSFLVVLLNPNKQGETVEVSQAVKSPAELTTFASLTFAYRRGGMEAVEQICDKALAMAGPPLSGISVQNLLGEFNGKIQKGQSYGK